MEWMPIETIPLREKVWMKKGGAVEVGWFSPECRDVEFPFHFIDPSVLDGWNAWSVDYPPTHWAPLTPPTA